MQNKLMHKSHETILDSQGNEQKVKVVNQYDIPSNASCEYYEEVIEESEEESDFQDINGLEDLGVELN